MLPYSLCQGWPELLDPAQDGPPADVKTSIREHAGDTLCRSTQLQVIANGEQDDVAREAMTRDQAGGFCCGMAGWA